MLHILESIEAIDEYTLGLTEEIFFHNREKQDAVIRRIEIIEEAARSMPSDSKLANPDIPWQDIADMRNKLIHEYFGVDLELVWEVVRKDLPKLQLKLPILSNICIDRITG